MDEKIASLRQYNFWGNDSFDLGYRRSEYTDKIADYVGNRLIKVLVGQRSRKRDDKATWSIWVAVAYRRCSC